MIYLISILGLIIAIFTWWKPKWAIFLTLALIPFHAFLVTFFGDLLALTEAQKTLFASWKELILAVLTVKIIWQIYWQGQFPFKILLIDKLIFSLFILSLITFAVFKIDLVAGIWGLRSDFELFLIYFLARSFIWSKPEIIKIIKIILATGGIVAIFGLLQAWFLPKDFLTHFGYSSETVWSPGKSIPAFQGIGDSGVSRVQSFLAGPNQLGSYLLILISLTLAILIYQKNLKNRFIVGILALIFGLALFYTYSRAAWLSLGAILIAGSFFWANFRTGKKHLIKIALSYLGVILLLVILAKSGAFGGKFTDVYLKHQTSTPERIVRLKDALVEISKNPLGIGIGKAGLVSVRFPGKKIILPESWYLQIGLELGILGLIIFLAIIWEFFRNLWFKFKQQANKFGQDLVLGTLLAFWGLSIYSLFFHTWSDISTTFVFWFLLGLVFTFNKLPVKETK